MVNEVLTNVFAKILVFNNDGDWDFIFSKNKTLNMF